MKHATNRFVMALSGAVALLALAGPTPAAEKTYDVQLTRPDAVGDKLKVVGEGASIQRVTVVVAGQRTEQPETGAGIKLEGTAEILAVTPKGRATKVSVNVDRCVRVSGPEESELLPKGSVLIAEAVGKDTKFSLKEGQLPEGASEVLELLVQLSADDSRGTDDELFGTKEKREVGATWPANAERVAKDFAAENFVIDATNVSGTVKLDAVEQVDGAERLKVSGKIRVKDLRPKPDGNRLPDGIVADVGGMDYSFTVSLPTDPTNKSGDESMSAVHRMTYKGDVPGVTTEVTMNRAASLKRTAMK